MPPITQYGSIAGMELVGVNANALSRFTAPQKIAALASTSRRMDSYFRKLFTLPFVQVGEDINRCANILAAFDLLAGRGFSPDGDDSIIVTRSKAEVQWLERVAAGLAIPDVTDSSVNASEGVPAKSPMVVSGPSRGYSVRGTGRLPGPFQGS